MPLNKGYLTSDRTIDSLLDIENIENIKCYGKRLVKKNVPDFIKVTEHEFNTFIRNRSLIYIKDRLRGFPDTIDYFDKYDNHVACKSLRRSKGEFYFINPELYDKGQKEKRKIADEYSDDIGLSFTIDKCTSITI